MCFLVRGRNFGHSKYCVVILFALSVTLTILYLKFRFKVEQNYKTPTVRVFEVETTTHHREAVFRYDITGDLTEDPGEKSSPLTDRNYPTENLTIPKTQDVRTSHSYRIQFIQDGRCIGISESKEPVVKFCDPQQNDDFVFVDGKIKFRILDLCFGLEQFNSSHLAFLNCTEAINFELTDSRLIYKDKSSKVKKCISAYSFVTEESKWKIPPHNNLGSHLGLTKAGCLEKSGEVKLIKETSFIQDRAALMLPLPVTSGNSCNFSACGINKSVPPVKSLPISQIERCLNLSQCVTVVTKTARRPLFVLRLAKSLRERFNMDLPMVVIDDDGPNSYNPAVMDEIKKFPKMKYVISSPDLGIAAGRTMGLKMVKTKYFMILDDDMVATEDTDISYLVEILDSTDATLVGGGSNFAGFLEFGRSEKGHPTLYHYQRSCTLANQIIPDFPNCFRCEITSNIFVARTKDALNVGGWSKELKIVEHKDFFLRLKAAGKKVVYCPEFKARNVHSNEGVKFVGGLTKVYSTFTYYEKRVRRVQEMMNRFCNRWNILHVKLIKNIIPKWIEEL